MVRRARALPLLQSWLTGGERPNRRLMVWAVIALSGGLLVYLAVTGTPELRLRIANIAGEVLTWVVVGYILAKAAPATVQATKLPAAPSAPATPATPVPVPPAAAGQTTTPPAAAGSFTPPAAAGPATKPPPPSSDA